MTFLNLFKMIEDLIQGNYDPWEFSFDLPDAMVEFHDMLKQDNSKLYLEMQENLPDICAELDDEEELYEPFRRKIELEFLRIKKVCGIK